MEDEILVERRLTRRLPWMEICLNRPQKGNALTMAMVDRLRALADELAADRETRAVVLRGKGRFFCTGGDIEDWGQLSPNEMGRDCRWTRRTKRSMALCRRRTRWSNTMCTQ